MQEYYRHPTSPRPGGSNSGGAGSSGGAGRGGGAPHGASSTSSASYATVRPLPTPQGWGGQGVTSPTLGSGGYAAGQQRSFNAGLEERRTSAGGQATDWSGGYAGYRRDGQTLTSPGPSSSSTNSIPYQQRPHSPLPPVPHQQPSTSYPTYPSISSPPPPSASPTSPIPRSHSPLPPSSGCMATTDHDSFVRVSLAGHTSSEAIKESIMTKLHIPDDDFFRYSLYLTPLGGGEGRQLGDKELWDVMRRGEQGSAVYAKLVISGGSSAGGGGFGGEEDGALPAGMSAERMRQVGRERAKERERAEQREREGSATSASGGGISSPTSLHSATAPVGAHPRRHKSPSISSRSDVSGGAGEFGERQRSPSSGGGGEGSGLRSDRPSWTWSHGQRGEGHQRHGSASGGLSPPMSGGRDRAGSITPTAPEGRHDGEWAHSPPLASAGATQTFSTIRSPQPPPPIQPPPLTSSTSAGSQQVVMGPSGPTRRLPPQPGQEERRTHTIPGPNGGVQLPPVSAQPWSRSIPPPQAPQPRTLATHPHPHPHPQPPPIITRPLPPTDPRSNLPQYQPYVSGQPQPAPAMFHNIALQGASPYPSYSPNPSSNGPNSLSPPLNSSSTFSSSLNPDRTVLMSKSADNLRGHYAQAFDHDLRPPPVPPQPPTTYRGAGTPNGHPGAMGSRPPYPPQPPQHPHSSQAQPPPLQHQNSFPPVFDPRVMTVPLTPVSAGGSSNSSSSYYRSPLPSASSNPPSQPPPSTTTNRPPQPSPYGPINGPQPGQIWTTVPPPQRRPSDHAWLPQGQLHQPPQAYHPHPHPPQPPRPPLPAVDTTRHINLQPGETLQSATSTNAPSAPKPTAPPPAAAHMRASDPALDAFGIGVPSAGEGVGDRDRYGAVEMRRDASGGAGGVPRALRAGGGRTSGGGGGRERDSGSSFASSTASSSAGAGARREERGGGGGRERREEQRSSVESTTSAASRRNTPQPSAPAADDGDAYGGMSADEGASTFYHSSHPRSSPHPQSDHHRTSRFTSPPSSARSSASGPLTPAQDNVPPVVIQQPDERTVELDEFGDPIGDDAATWFPVNQPLKSPPIAVVAGAADETGTARAHEWAQAVLERMGGGAAGGSGEEAEQTLTRTLQPASATEKEKEEATVTPSTATATVTAPTEDDDESKFADVDEFGDDPADDSTYFAGFGPARPSFSPTDSTNPAPTISTTTTTTASTTVSPTSPVIGVSLRDEPSSRSPTSDRLKRPNLRLKIENPPTPPDSHSSSTTGARAGDGKTSANPSPASSSSGNLRRAAAAGEPGDLASFMSSRRAERAERIRATASSRQQDSLMALGHSASHSPNGGMLRRNSFRAREEDDKDWAIRPAVETVLENLDVFFPDVDLDKPVFDLPTPAPSTPSPVKEAGPSPPGVTERSASASSVQQMAPSSTTSSGAFFPTAPPPIHPARRAISSAAGLPGATGLSHKKSIRVVAQDRKRAMQKAGRNVVTAVSGLGSNLLRRKSTKLFGARIEEVTSAQLGRISTTIRESPDDDPQNFSYKWIKGDLIGRGTFGHVYIGFSVNTGETIAVKQVELPKSQHDKDDARTKGMVQSLKAEIELLKDLDHPNIVLYLGMEQTPEHLSIFLEYVPGGSVGRIVRTHGKFEENVIKFFTYQILEGLEYLHSLGILHRDMKADNILTDQDGMCKISDFGTSKKSTDIYSNNENMSMQGSIFWMAPEVIHNKNMGYSAKADIWSLGCILIEMFAGRRPWSDEEAIQAMFKLGAERLAPPVPPDVTLSPLAESFLNDCLQIDANDRPKAYQLRDNDFLKLESTWSFTQTDLYRQMADDEARRRAISSHPSG